MPNTNLVTWTLGDENFTVDLYDIDGVEWTDMKRATGYKRQELLQQALVDTEFDACAAFIWVIKRRQDPSVTYREVLKSITIRAVEGETSTPNDENSEHPSESNGRGSPVLMGSAHGNSTY